MSNFNNYRNNQSTSRGGDNTKNEIELLKWGNNTNLLKWERQMTDKLYKEFGENAAFMETDQNVRFPRLPIRDANYFYQ